MGGFELLLLVKKSRKFYSIYKQFQHPLKEFKYYESGEESSLFSGIAKRPMQYLERFHEIPSSRDGKFDIDEVLAGCQTDSQMVKNSTSVESPLKSTIPVAAAACQSPGYGH